MSNCFLNYLQYYKKQGIVCLALKNIELVELKVL